MVVIMIYGACSRKIVSVLCSHSLLFYTSIKIKPPKTGNHTFISFCFNFYFKMDPVASVSSIVIEIEILILG